MLTYKEYILKHAKVYDSPVGDFITDARTDPHLPDTLTKICFYIMERGCREAHQAERKCYQNYRNYCKRNCIEAE